MLALRGVIENLLGKISNFVLIFSLEENKCRFYLNSSMNFHLQLVFCALNSTSIKMNSIPRYLPRLISFRKFHLVNVSCKLCYWCRLEHPVQARNSLRKTLLLVLLDQHSVGSLLHVIRLQRMQAGRKKVDSRICSVVRWLKRKMYYTLSCSIFGNGASFSVHRGLFICI